MKQISNAKTLENLWIRTRWKLKQPTEQASMRPEDRRDHPLNGEEPEESEEEPLYDPDNPPPPPTPAGNKQTGEDSDIPW
jgi:hypothetical protein